ncbi:MAG TPA: hypothetical protein PLV92_28565, partial [Pirellulaceae bacterium]|nr:hypothetical protein [Pirellulaceae bacterium]
NVAELRRMIADGVSFELLDVGAARASNAAVTGLALRDPLVTTDRDVVVEAEVRDFGSSDSSTKRIEFLLDGRKVAEQSIELPANGRAVASASFRCDGPGPHVLEAVLHTDGLELDNHRWLSFDVRDRVRVLCVEGRPGEARYVALALESQNGGKKNVQVEVDAEHALVDRELTDFDLICLCNVGRVAAAEAKAIRSALEQGVGVAVFLGDELRWEDYRETLASDGPRRVLPARPSAPSPVGVYRFVAGEYRDPLVAPFRGQERAGLLSTPVWKYVPLEPASSSARIALTFDDGRPAIVHERIGRGLSTLFATAASPDSLDRSTTPPTPWSAWATWPSFLPIVQQTLRLSLATRSEDRNVTVGGEWTFA